MQCFDHSTIELSARLVGRFANVFRQFNTSLLEYSIEVAVRFYDLVHGRSVKQVQASPQVNDGANDEWFAVELALLMALVGPLQGPGVVAFPEVNTRPQPVIFFFRLLEMNPAAGQHFLTSFFTAAVKTNNKAGLELVKCSLHHNLSVRFCQDTPAVKDSGALQEVDGFFFA